MKSNKGDQDEGSKDQPPIRRPKISLALEREVLIECGHRCAVCGEAFPLEKAHIIPWCKTREHKFENLICLCANCHSRADKDPERWGPQALLEYKRKPWVVRRFSETTAETRDSRVRFNLAIEFDSFDTKYQVLLTHAIASFLGISPSAVKISSVEKGSVRVAIDLPFEAAVRLRNAISVGDPLLRDFLVPFGGIFFSTSDIFPFTERESPGFDCKEVSECLFLYLDNEMANDTVVRFKAHVEGCSNCSRRFEYMADFLSAVRTGSKRKRAPQLLVERILSWLRQDSSARNK